MVLSVDLSVVIPAAAILFFIAVAVAKVWEDRFPAFGKYGEPMGKYRFALEHEDTGRGVYRNRNVVRLTREILSPKEGPTIVKDLRMISAQADFVLPGQSKQQIVDDFQRVEKKLIAGSRYPIFEDQDETHLEIFGLGSIWSRPEIAIIRMPAGRHLEDYVIGRYGRRRRPQIPGRQYRYPGNTGIRKNFLGKTMIKFSVIDVEPQYLRNGSSDESSEQLHVHNENMREYTRAVVSLVRLLGELKPTRELVKVLKKQRDEALQLVEDAKRKLQSMAADEYATRKVDELSEEMLGQKGRITGPRSAALLVIVPVAASIIGDYAFTANPSPFPVVFTVIGSLVAVSLLSSRR